MRKEYLQEMSASEIDTYAKCIGVDTSKAKQKARKIAIICESRERSAEIDVLGMTLSVPIKKMHDKRITDRASNVVDLSELEFEQLMVDIIGQEQMDALSERCTDEDGTVDIDALALALTSVITSDKLKNF